VSDSGNDVLVVIPTYNELDNLRVIVDGIAQYHPSADVLIVDDNSPDGTGDLADQISAQRPNVHVLHRVEKRGLGRAYVAGLTWALDHRYEIIAQMDADMSHDPSYLPGLVETARQYGLALGSRYVSGGGVRNWGVVRRILSRGGNMYARFVLGVDVRDLTGGFKCWRQDVLRDIGLSTVSSNGYCFQIETTYRALLRGHSVKEFPIVFSDRTSGRSKMSKAIMAEAVLKPWRLRALARTASSGFATDDPAQ